MDKTVSCMQVFLPIRRYRVGSGISLEESRVVVGGDTVFGALCWAVSTLYGGDKCKELVESFRKRTPPFLVSSAFPSKLKDGKVFSLLPFPSIGVLRRRVADRLCVDRKRVEGAEFTSVAGLAAMLNNNFDVLVVEDVGLPAVVCRDEMGNLPQFKILKSYRNVLDRLFYSSNVFRFSFVELFDGCGLSFWVRFFDEGVRDLVCSAVRLLNEMGLGGERSIGFGVGEGDVIFIDGDVGFGGDSVWMSLSPYIPNGDEIGLFHGRMPLSYVLMERTAFYTFGRVRYFCFSEGSVFPRLDGVDVYGRMVDVEGISRYGYAFAVGLGELGFEFSGD